jgi:hypothetical protein
MNRAVWIIGVRANIRYPSPVCLNLSGKIT